MHRQQQQIRARIADPTPQAGIQNRLELADKIEILVVAAEHAGTESRQFGRPQLMLAVRAKAPVTPFHQPLHGTEAVSL